jgi:hypothetical protein
VTGCREIEGVVDVTMEPMDRKLTLSFDPRRTTRERVTAALQVILDSVD